MQRTNDCVMSDARQRKAPTQELSFALRFRTTMDDLQRQYLNGKDATDYGLSSPLRRILPTAAKAIVAIVILGRRRIFAETGKLSTSQ